jgi:hypothetical protein
LGRCLKLTAAAAVKVGRWRRRLEAAAAGLSVRPGRAGLVALVERVLFLEPAAAVWVVLAQLSQTKGLAAAGLLPLEQ